MSCVCIQRTFPNTQTKVVAAIGSVALATLITGIVLAILQNPSSLSTALMATGGTVAGLSILYLINNYLDELKKVDLHEQLGYVPQEVSSFNALAIGKAILKGDTEALAEAIRPIQENWEQAKKTKSEWTLEELGTALGVDGNGFKIAMNFFPELKAKIPEDGILTTAFIEEHFKGLTELL